MLAVINEAARAAYKAASFLRSTGEPYMPEAELRCALTRRAFASRWGALQGGGR